MKKDLFEAPIVTQDLQIVIENAKSNADCHKNRLEGEKRTAADCGLMQEIVRHYRSTIFAQPPVRRRFGIQS